ncbi:MAG: hypothetical protein AAGI01_04255 [Myxococcota bacterium]
MEDRLLALGVVLAFVLGAAAVGEGFLNAPLHDRSLVSWHDAGEEDRRRTTRYLFERQFARAPSDLELATYVDCINVRANSSGVNGMRTSVHTAFKGCRAPQ